MVKLLLNRLMALFYATKEIIVKKHFLYLLKGDFFLVLHIRKYREKEKQ